MARIVVKQLPLWAVSVVVVLILLVACLLTVAGYRFIRPIPPGKMTMATGREGGTYAVFGERYRQALARDGVRVELRPSSGAVENLNLLQDVSKKVDAAFVQGLLGRIDESSNLVSLGSIAYTPLWVFYRGGETYDDLSQLKGKRIIIGPEGSAMKKFSLALLKTAGVSGPPTVLYEHGYEEGRQAILSGRADVMMVLTSAENHQFVADLLRTPGIKLMNFSQAEAYTRLFPDLSHVVLPRGIIDPSKRLPSEDVHLLSPTTNLIVRKDLHPALVYLLLKAAADIHGGAGIFNKAGEFPSPAKQDDPISEQALRFYKSGGSPLYNYLPFWAATFAERIILILIPLGIAIVPLIGILPWVYTWKNRSKFYRWYRELMDMEKAYTAMLSPDDIRTYYANLNRIEEAVNKTRVSAFFYDEVFILKGHIQLLREKLRLNHQNIAATPGNAHGENPDGACAKDGDGPGC